MSPRAGLDMNNILQAAAELADKQGLSEVTLTSLAKILNVRTPSLYNHFDGLQMLREKLAIYGLQKLYETLLYAAIGKSSDDAVHSLANAYVSFARDHPGLYSATLNVPDKYDDELKKISSQIVDVVLRVLSAYGLSGDSAVHATRGLRSILHGFSSLEQNEEFRMSQNLDESFKIIINIFIEGLKGMQSSINE